MTKKVKPSGSVFLYADARGEGTRYRGKRKIKLIESAKSITVTAYGSSEAEAWRKLDIKEAEVRHKHAVKTDLNTLTVRHLAMLVLQKKKDEGLKITSMSGLLSTMRTHITPLLGDYLITDVTLEQLQALQNKLIHEGKFSPASCVRSLLKEIYIEAQIKIATSPSRNAITLTNLALLLPSPKKLRRTLENKVVTHVLNISTGKDTQPKKAVWSDAEVIGFLDASKREYLAGLNLMYPLFFTGFNSGMRRGELFGLTWDAVRYQGEQPIIDIRKQIVIVNGHHFWESPKSKSSVRMVAIEQFVYDLLHNEHRQVQKELAKSLGKSYGSAKILRGTEGLVFAGLTGNPISPKTYYRVWYRLIEQQGLYRLTPHNMRKFFTTTLTENLINSGHWHPTIVSQALGHSSTEIAQRVYQVLKDDHKFMGTVGIGSGNKKE